MAVCPDKAETCQNVTSEIPKQSSVHVLAGLEFSSGCVNRPHLPSVDTMSWCFVGAVTLQEGEKQGAEHICEKWQLWVWSAGSNAVGTLVMQIFANTDFCLGQNISLAVSFPGDLVPWKDKTEWGHVQDLGCWRKEALDKPSMDQTSHLTLSEERNDKIMVNEDSLQSHCR